MKYKIYFGESIIGESNLEFIDKGMNVRLGRFAPTPVFEQVRPIFNLFLEAMFTEPVNEEMLQSYYKARDELGLKVVGEDGVELQVGAVHIENLALDIDIDPAEYQIKVFPPNE